jgi:hypothetical protein
MSARTKSPGFDQRSGNRNRRVNRYLSGAVGGGNHSSRRHRLADGVGLAFVSPDQITDTENDLAKFNPIENVDVQGSVAQDGVYTVDTRVAGQLDMIEQTITAEIAGPSIAVRSLDNRRDGKFT